MGISGPGDRRERMGLRPTAVEERSVGIVRAGRKGMTALFLASLTALFFLPEISIPGPGEGGFRLEDLLGASLLAMFLARAAQGGRLGPVALLVPLILYTLAVTAAAVATGRSTAHALMFWGREVAWFGLLIGGWVAARHSRARLRSFVQLLGLLLLAVAVYQFGAGIRAYYGIGALGAMDSPSVSGLTYAAAGILVYTVSATRRRGPLDAHELVLSFGLLTVAALTVSRLTIVAVGAFAVVILLAHPDLLGRRNAVHRHRLLRRQALVAAGAAAVVLAISGVRLFDLQIERTDSYRRISGRVGEVPAALEERTRIHASRLDRMDGPGEVLAGWGRGGLNMHAGNFRDWTMMGDNQYVRNLLELGIVGSILWFGTLFCLAGRLWPEPDLVSLYLALLLAYLGAAVGAEVFLLSRSGPAFWATTGILMGVRDRRGPRGEGRGHQ